MREMRRPKAGAVLAASVLCAASAPSQAALIVPGRYALANHPDGGARSPLYGLRLDELYDATSNHDIFTFDFDDSRSEMWMDITLNAAPSTTGGTVQSYTIHLFGSAFGGRDIGTQYAAEPTTGVYLFDFTYQLGVSQVPGDDDLWAIAQTGSNIGSITTPASAGGDVIPLWDKNNGTYNFRLGDHDDNTGHRQFNGISGWGWMNHTTPNSHVSSTDWLFTAAHVPAPASISIALVASGLFASRRRRASARCIALSSCAGTICFPVSSSTAQGENLCPRLV